MSRYTISFLVLLLWGGEAFALRLESPSFKEGEAIPRRHTCDGENISPPLNWVEPPDGTQSFALVADDPDAPTITWVHWVVYNLSADTAGLQEGVEKLDTLANGGKQGTTDFQTVGYDGPCPPPGKPHRYFFKLYALDQTLTLPSPSGKTELLVAMNGHVLAQADLVGNYSRDQA